MCRLLLFGCLLAMGSPLSLRAADLAQLLARERQIAAGAPTTLPELAALRAAIAKEQIKAGNREKAADYLYNSLQLVPDDPERWELLGDVVNFLPGDSADAVAQFAYQEALTREPDRTSARMKLAASYLVSERYRDAVDQLELLLKRRSGRPNVEHMKLLGAAYAMSDQLERGRRFFEERYAATREEDYRIAARILREAEGAR